jgi:hypothetical protein
MPVRVVGLLMREERDRRRRNASAARKGKAMGVVDMMGLD